MPAKTELADTVSAALKREGLKFVGPTMIYSVMQVSACHLLVGLLHVHGEWTVCALVRLAAARGTKASRDVVQHSGIKRLAAFC